MSPAIQQVVNAVLFKNKNDDGIRWARYYKPFPVAGFTLTITVVRFDLYEGRVTHYIEQIECAINEWESGVREMIVFKEHEFSSVYKKHFDSLEEFKTMTALIGLLTKLLQQVHNDGW